MHTASSSPQRPRSWSLWGGNTQMRIKSGQHGANHIGRQPRSYHPENLYIFPPKLTTQHTPSPPSSSSTTTRDSLQMANSTVSEASLLYANTDFTKLNWLEAQWAAWYLWIGNPILATGLASFLLHEVRPAAVAPLACHAHSNTAGRLLWPCNSMDHHRRDTVL